MDEETDNPNPPVEMPKADQETLKKEGVEILDQNQPQTENYEQEVQRPKTIGDILGETKKAPFLSSSNDPDIKPIRTYTSDAEEAIQKNKTSVINIAVAEQKKKELTGQEPEEKTSRSNKILWFSITFILIALGIVGATYYFLVIGSGSAPQTVNTVVPTPLVSTDQTKTFTIDQKNPPAALAETISGLSFPVGSLVYLVPTDTSGDIVASSSAFFSAIGINVPEQVALSFDNTYTFGVLVSSVNHPFIVLGISSYENAFPGMLSWEKTIHDDMIGLIQIDHPNESLTSFSTEHFIDTRIANQDVRELVDASSSPILIYTFIGTNKLIIATDENTLGTVINKINTVSITR